jgi:hypothetical protein
MMARILDSRDTDVRGVQKFVSAVLAEHDVALAFLRVFEHVDERERVPRLRRPALVATRGGRPETEVRPN